MEIKNNKKITFLNQLAELKSLVRLQVNKSVEKQVLCFHMLLMGMQVAKATFVVNFRVSFYSYF